MSFFCFHQEESTLNREPGTEEEEDDDETAKELVTKDGRTVSYALVAPAEPKVRQKAILYFYPLSGCSLVISNMRQALQKYQCSVISVDRPSCAATSPLPRPVEGEDFVLHRIRGHVQDVLAVLEKENIELVYVLGVCLGHPYAIELCRQILLDSTNSLPRLGGITLVAPFVSTACPEAWRVARFGSSVPSSVLYGFTEFAIAASAVLLPTLLRPSMLKKLVTEEERKEFGWMEEDFEAACQTALEMTKITQKGRAVEARLGTSPTWQSEVCDKFAVESGCGLQTDDADSVGEVTSTVSEPLIPIRIHVSLEDKVAPIASVEWVARRCYGGCQVVEEENIHSHEVMTFFGGPPRNPALLHKIARDWGLLPED